MKIVSKQLLPWHAPNETVLGVHLSIQKWLLYRQPRSLKGVFVFSKNSSYEIEDSRSLVTDFHVLRLHFGCESFLKILPNSFILFYLSSHTGIHKSQINIIQFWIHFVNKCHAVLSIRANCDLNIFQNIFEIFFETFWKFYSFIRIVSRFDWWWISQISCPICLNGSNRIK